MDIIERKYTTACEKEHNFLCSTEEHSAVFDSVVSRFLRTLNTFVGGYFLVSGSAVLAEACRQENSLFVFEPADIDIYVSDEFNKISVGTPNTDKFLYRLGKALSHVGIEIVDEQHPEKLPEQYTVQLGDGFTIDKVVTFKLEDYENKSRKIQLIVVAENEKPFKGTSIRFKMCILRHMDINICRGHFDITSRIITYPTDKMIFHYVRNRTFYYEPNHGSDWYMMERIFKYRSRMFKHLGYYDRRNFLGHRIADDSFYCNINVHAIFLPNKYGTGYNNMRQGKAIREAEEEI